MRWLPSKTTATIASMEFISRGVMQGFIAGRHKSPHKGFSIEFAEHRQYTPGDDLRNLDWHVLARSDRSYIKQYVEETNLRATILVDTSGSMKYRGDAAAAVENAPCSKLEYAQYLAAILSYLFIGQQDAVGLVTFDTAIRTYIPARARASQVRALLEALDATKPGGETAIADIFHDIAERIPRRGLVIIISDLFDDPERIVNALHHFRHRRHEVVVLHVLADEELTFPFDQFTRFRNLEGVSDIQTDPKALRASYLEQIRLFLQAIKNGCGRIGADYVAMNTATPFDQALSAYLTRRRTGQG
ncbi:MAG: DUF58 domain-containing protein [Lentisphaerae bacterium]|nr:DUF58 domain-containing protein [Lentisphaerota bacterium]